MMGVAEPMAAALTGVATPMKDAAMGVATAMGAAAQPMADAFVAGATAVQQAVVPVTRPVGAAVEGVVGAAEAFSAPMESLPGAGTVRRLFLEALRNRIDWLKTGQDADMEEMRRLLTTFDPAAFGPGADAALDAMYERMDKMGREGLVVAFETFYQFLFELRYMSDAAKPRVYGLLYEQYRAIRLRLQDRYGTRAKDRKSLSLVAGHGMGGILAQMATVDLSPKARCMTFGSPKAGNTAFVDLLKERALRYVLPEDPKPAAPESMPIIAEYLHTPRKFRLEFPYADPEMFRNRMLDAYIESLYRMPLHRPEL